MSEDAWKPGRMDGLDGCTTRSQREPWELQYQTTWTFAKIKSSDLKRCAALTWHEKVLCMWLHRCCTCPGIVFSPGWARRRKEIKSSSLPGARDSRGAIGFADGSPARAFTHGCSALCMGDSTLSNPSRTIKVLALKAGGLTPLSLPPPSHSTMHQSHGLRNAEKEGEAGLWSHVNYFFFFTN